MIMMKSVDDMQLIVEYAAALSVFAFKICFKKVLFRYVIYEQYIKPIITIHDTDLTVVETFLGSKLINDGCFDAGIFLGIRKISLSNEIIENAYEIIV